MIRHLLKLVWNRKRANVLIAVEILLSFLVLAAVATMIVYYVDNYRRPLGYAWQDTWVVSMDANVQDLPGSDTDTPAPGTGPRARSMDRTTVTTRSRATLGIMSLLLFPTTAYLQIRDVVERRRVPDQEPRISRITRIGCTRGQDPCNSGDPRFFTGP